MLNGKKIGQWVLVVALYIVVASALYTNYLAKQLATEEKKRVEMWAEATNQLILADENTNIDFLTQIIEQNTTIPVYITDADGNILQSRNVKRPIDDPRTLQGPIEVNISNEITQYIYYDDSLLLKQLSYFPYIQLTIIFLFIVVAFVTLYVAQRSEQNRVWVGLSKETAHQLGTPISSLNAWKELLEAKYPDDELIPQMGADVARLQTIAERFSKVGSEPKLSPTPVISILEQAIAYMRTRVSSKVEIELTVASDEEIPWAEMNVNLFGWVLENLIKNAVDAMEGKGKISISVSHKDSEILIDVKDTGKGIDRRKINRVFQPGFTTKKRGWGLGLSLAKRIIEDYHRGKLFVKESEIGKGTTFRIVLKKAENRGAGA